MTSMFINEEKTYIYCIVFRVTELKLVFQKSSIERGRKISGCLLVFGRPIFEITVQLLSGGLGHVSPLF